MADAKLTVGDLMEGALALVSKRPLTVGAFVLLLLVASYGTTYVAYNLGFVFGILMALCLHGLATSLLFLMIADGRRALLSDPLELLIRLASLRRPP